ncbi:hypothetical protein OC834_008044, partial [Tilletia horrida]
VVPPQAACRPCWPGQERRHLLGPAGAAPPAGLRCVLNIKLSSHPCDAVGRRAVCQCCGLYGRRDSKAWPMVWGSTNGAVPHLGHVAANSGIVGLQYRRRRSLASACSRHTASRAPLHHLPLDRRRTHRGHQARPRRRRVRRRSSAVSRYAQVLARGPAAGCCAPAAETPEPSSLEPSSLQYTRLSDVGSSPTEGHRRDSLPVRCRGHSADSGARIGSGGGSRARRGEPSAAAWPSLSNIRRTDRRPFATNEPAHGPVLGVPAERRATARRAQGSRRLAADTFCFIQS